MSEEEFKNVWYLPKEITWEDKRVFPIKHSGTLKLKGDCIEFICNNELIKITNIKHISFGKQGRDFINNWVKIEYQDGKTAFFADGNSAGWSGIMGGTNRIFNAIKNNIKSEVKMDETFKGLKNLDDKILSDTEDGIYCPECGRPVKRSAIFCVHCGVQIKEINATKTIQYKDKTVAVLLSFFFGFWAWIYTWEKDQIKFWIGLGITILSVGFGYIAFWIWAVVNSTIRTQEFYNNYPN